MHCLIEHPKVTRLIYHALNLPPPKPCNKANIPFFKVDYLRYFVMVMEKLSYPYKDETKVAMG